MIVFLAARILRNIDGPAIILTPRFGVTIPIRIFELAGEGLLKVHHHVRILKTLHGGRKDQNQNCDQENVLDDGLPRTSHSPHFFHNDAGAAPALS